MAINETAYNTVACMSYKTQNIVSQIAKGLAANSLSIRKITLSNSGQEIKIGLIQGGNIYSDTIPYFNHPIFVHDTNKEDEQPIVFVDVRNYGIYNRPQQKFILRNRTEYIWSIYRAILNYIWIYGRKETLRDLSLLPSSAYSSMIAESVGRRYALDMAQQTILQVLACYYYYCLFTDNKEFDEMEMNRVVGAVARSTGVNTDFIYTVLEGLPVINTLPEFCKYAKEKTQSVSMIDFDVGILFSITGGSWFGTNSREMMAVALEHVPTWVMIVYGGITEATFKRSVLAKLLERLAKKHASDVFAKNVITLLATDVSIDDTFEAADSF